MTPDDPRRVRAKIIQILKNREANGDCFLNVKEILEIIEKEEDLAQKIQINIRDLKAEKKFYEEKLYWKPVEDQIYLYRKEIHEMEELIETNIRNLIDVKQRQLPAINFEELLRKLDDRKFPKEKLEQVRKEKTLSFTKCFQKQIFHNHRDCWIRQDDPD